MATSSPSIVACTCPQHLPSLLAILADAAAAALIRRVFSDCVCHDDSQLLARDNKWLFFLISER